MLQSDKHAIGLFQFCGTSMDGEQVVAFSWKMAERGDEVAFTLSGELNFDAHEHFRTMIDEAEKFKGRRFALDLAGVPTVDSAALGMLLLFKERVGGRNAVVCLLRPNDIVTSILKLVNFQRYFDMR